MPRRDPIDDLRRLTRAATAGVVTLDRAAADLGLTPREATLRLGALARLGAIRRIRRALYLVPPLNTPDRAAAQIRSEEALAYALYRPCYVGGWTAAMRWKFPCVTRRETLIVTSARVRANDVRIEGARLHLHRLPESLVVGPGIETTSGGLTISGPERTLVDALRAPGWIGGVRFLQGALCDYRLSDAWDPDELLLVLEEAGNSAAIRRLGAISDAAGVDFSDVLGELENWRRKGVIDLEPGAGKEGPIARWWRVRLNVDLHRRDFDHSDAEDGQMGYDEEYDDWLVEMESETIRERGASG